MRFKQIPGSLSDARVDVLDNLWKRSPVGYLLCACERFSFLPSFCFVHDTTSIYLSQCPSYCNKFGRVVVHTHELTCITSISDQWLNNRLRKNEKNRLKKSAFSLKFSATTVSQGVETHNKTCSQVVVQIYQVPMMNLKKLWYSWHNKELSILRVQWQRSQKRSSRTWCQFLQQFDKWSTKF